MNIDNVKNSSFWVSPQIASVSQGSKSADEFATLFDAQLKQDISKMNDVSVKIANQKSQSLLSMCELINNLFKNSTSALTFYMYTVHKDKKICLQSFCGMPNITLAKLSKNRNDIHINSHRSGKNFNPIGWQNIRDPDEVGIKGEFLTTLVNTTLLDVCKINVWKWGFQIITVSNINIVACLSFVIVPKTIVYYDWQVPFRDSFKTDEQINKLITTWVAENSAEDQSDVHVLGI